MNCREFRRKHDAYIDDTLSGVELEGMARHRRLCDRCAQLDTRIRRALLVARNLPTIQPSPAFSEQLWTRLKSEQASLLLARRIEEAKTTHWHSSLSTGAYTAITAGVIIAAGLAGATTLSRTRDDVVRLAPVVALGPAPDPSTLAAPTIMAAVPAGVPFWPAVFVAQQAPWHFASDATGR